MKVFVRVSVLLFISAVVGLISLMIILAPEPVSAGGGMISPDRKYLATLNSVVVRRYFRRTICYYEFKCFGVASEEERIRTNYRFRTRPLHSVRVPVDHENQLVTIRGEPPFPIQWNSDSSAVKTQIGAVEISIRMEVGGSD